ncbi:MAG: hypothetical protein LBK29_02565 [Oscillospiraceae bacterium]|jgi:hypothetical protein|nr:hypothetical protein [Oscillospiraceae bacterium]
MGYNDVNKPFHELTGILNRKMEEKEIRNKVNAVIKFLRSSPAPSLFEQTIEKLKNTYEKYTNKFKSCLKIKDPIKLYSNYSALKRIGEICNEFLKGEMSEKEFQGAMSEVELKKEQKKFELRAKLGKFGNSKDEKLLAEFFANRNLANSDDPDGPYFIKTPFWDIKMECRVQNGRETRMISANPGVTELNYRVMSKNLDEALSKLSLRNEKLDFITCMKNYICRKTNEKEPKDLSVTQFPDNGKLTKEQRESAAVLCGCLLFAESSEIRNPTRGKWERKAIEKIERLVNNSCLNPFHVVFSGDKAQYSDRTYSESTMYLPAKSKPERTRGERVVNPFHKGGQFQAEWLIKHKANIRRDILLDDEIKHYDLVIRSVSNIKLSKVEKVIDDYFLILKEDKFKIKPNSQSDVVRHLESIFRDIDLNNPVKNYSNLVGCLEEDKNRKKFFESLFGGLNQNKRKYLKLYFKSDERHNRIKIENIPDDFAEARKYILEEIKDNRISLANLDN